MALAITILRYILFLFSLLGYAAFGQKKLLISKQASFIFAFSVVGCALYFFALLGLLSVGVYILFILGFILLLWMILSDKWHLSFIKGLTSPINILFLAVFLFLFIFLIDHRFTHIDNYSHWGTAVKNMVITNQLPDQNTYIIHYKSYPPGTGVLLYFACKIAGHSQGVMVLTQALIILACFYALFGVTAKAKSAIAPILLGLALSTLAFINPVPITELLVDFLLPLVALAAIANLMSQKDASSAAILSALPVIGLLTLIKNTGVFFALFPIVYLIYSAFTAYKKTKQKKILITAIAVLFFSLLPVIVWNIHLSTQFPTDSSKFNLQNPDTFALAKTSEEISAIIRQFFSQTFSLAAPATQVFLIIHVAFIIIWLLSKAVLKKPWRPFRFFLLLDIGILIYYLGLMAMYIFTMPLVEALPLAAFGRYTATMAVFAIGLAALTVFSGPWDKINWKNLPSLFIPSKKSNGILTAASLAVLLLILYPTSSKILKQKTNYPNTLAAQIENAIGDRWGVIDHSRFLVYQDGLDQNAKGANLRQISKYMLFATGVDSIDVLTDDTFLEKIFEYHYFVVIKEDDETAFYMPIYSNDDKGPGIYNVKEAFE